MDVVEKHLSVYGSPRAVGLNSQLNGDIRDTSIEGVISRD